MLKLLELLGALAWKRILRACALCWWTCPISRWLALGTGRDGCGGLAHRHGIREVELVDLPVFGCPARLVWRKQRWRCTGCGRCWCDENAEIGAARCALTTRAARWSTLQVSRNGRAVSDVARDLGCSWHTVMDAVVIIGEQLVDHPDRIGDVRQGQLLDVVPCRSAPEPCRWLAERDQAWLDRIEWATLDLSASHRTVSDTTTPEGRLSDRKWSARSTTTPTTSSQQNGSRTSAVTSPIQRCRLRFAGSGAPSHVGPNRSSLGISHTQVTRRPRPSTIWLHEPNESRSDS
jgi:hypothetical protein